MTTKETIQTSINSRLTSTPTQIEGGTISDIVGSVSYELAKIIDTMIEPVLDNAFVSTADEEHLKIRGEELLIYKKEASSAVVAATITNAQPNLLINTSVQAKTEENIIFQNIEDKYTDEEGTAVIIMRCTTKGQNGNIPANSLNRFCENYYGLENAEITNLKKAYDGFDEETTEEYRKRILEFLREDACNSNIADYKMWAKSITGVKKAVVADAMELHQAGHVNVFISAMNNAEVSNELISAVKEKIKKEQIINANVEVFPLEYFAIDIRAVLKLDSNVDINYVRQEFNEKLEEYLEKEPDVIPYLFISNILFDIEGILDVYDYYLCGEKESITLNKTQVAIMGSTVFEEAEQ